MGHPDESSHQWWKLRGACEYCGRDGGRSSEVARNAAIKACWVRGIRSERSGEKTGDDFDPLLYVLDVYFSLAVDPTIFSHSA